MTSLERHEARYQRRKAKRLDNRRRYTQKYDDFERLSSVSALIGANWASRKGVMWKASVARYNVKYFKNSRKSCRNLRKGKDTRQGFYNFQIVERGKPRDVHSLHYTERVIRRSVCTNAMVPILSHDLIYDNGASLKGKGVSFHIRECEKHLHEYWREEHSNAGYVLIIDFRKFFDNIEHSHVYNIYDTHFLDKKLNAICRSFVEATGTKGLYIGPEDSQITAVSFPNHIDHMIKDKWKIRYYGRYMDDSYIIMRDKERLIEVKNMLLEEFAKVGIVPNPKKTQIIKLSRGFTFLKTQFILTDTGRIVEKPCHASIVRERRKLKSFKRFSDGGLMTAEQGNCSYMSWRGSVKGKNSYRSIHEMDKLYFELFHQKPWIKKKRKRKGIIRYDSTGNHRGNRGLQAAA